MSPTSYICAVVVVVGLVTSSDGTRIVENDVTVSLIGACLRCNIALGAAPNDCELCYGTPTDIGLLQQVAQLRQSTDNDADQKYALNVGFSGRRRRVQCCRLFGTSSNCCRFEPTGDVAYDPASADRSRRRQPVIEDIKKRGYATSFLPLDDGPHGTGQCACCGTPRAFFNYACCMYNCYKK